MKKILVVVDMQNDFITGPLGTPEAVSIVDKVVEKIRGEEWDYIYTTQDTHDEYYLDTQEGKKLPIPHCIEGTDGWNLNDKIYNALHDRFMNNPELYWCAPQKFTFGCTELMMFIDRDIIRCGRDVHPQSDIELTLVGVCTDICVISNALLLKAHYPEMTIVVDASCCAGSTPIRHQEALDVMRSCQIDIINESLYRPAGWAEEAEKLFVGDKESEKPKKKLFNEAECKWRCNAAATADASCADFCEMECPYEEIASNDPDNPGCTGSYTLF